MEAPRPSIVRRRLRRGSVDLPLNTRLGRVGSIALVPCLLLVMFTVSRPGPFPAPLLPPAFDGRSAMQLTRELATRAPSRVPGSLGAADAAAWYREKLALYGLRTSADRWVEDVPGLGRTRLENLVTLIPGRSPLTIAVVAHRDNDGSTSGANDNASGTAALVELARSYGIGVGSGLRVRPLHTLAFVSTDAGAYGGLGALHIAQRWKDTRDVVAVITLDGIGGTETPRIAVAGNGRGSAPPALVRTLAARLARPGDAASTPGWLPQLVRLALGGATGEQALFIGEGIAAVGLGNAPVVPAERDEPGRLDRAMMTRIGRAAESALVSLDQAIRVRGSTSSRLFLGERALQGWAVGVLLVAFLVPYGAVVLDLLARLRRRGVRLTPAVRALRTRLGFWLFAGATVLVAALLDVLPTGPRLPPAPTSPAVTDWPVGGLVALGAVVCAAWLVTRTRLLPSRDPQPDEELAGQAVALAGVGVAGILAALASPLALILFLPSLLAWVWLPQLRQAGTWARDAVYGLGLAGPAAALVVIASELPDPARAPVYGLALLTTGVVPWLQTLAILVWAAAAAQLGAIEAGRYAPTRSRA